MSERDQKQKQIGKVERLEGKVERLEGKAERLEGMTAGNRRARGDQAPATSARVLAARANIIADERWIEAPIPR